MDALIPASMSLGAFGMMMPRLPDVRAAGPGSSVAADVRLGECAAGLIIITVGALISVNTGNKGAVKIAIVVVLLMVAIYEFALRISPDKGVS